MTLARRALSSAVFAAFLAVLLLLGGAVGPRPAQADIIILVDTTNDVIANDGACSLREAITAANSNANYFGCIGNGGGFDLIEFSLGGGVPVINVASSLPTITDPVEINGAPNRVQLHGQAAGLAVSGAGASGSIFRKLVLNGFSLSATTNITIAGNYIGTDAAGTAATGNGGGIYLTDASTAQIGGVNGLTDGGPCTGDCNLISGNTYGLRLRLGSNATIRGNFIGTDASGTSAIGNSNGIRVEDSLATIGGTATGAGNVISGNGTGINFLITTDNAVGSIIQGNRIGANATGSAAVPNGGGISVNLDNQSYPLVIGGSATGASNLISGNTGAGVSLTQADGVAIYGNRIGTHTNGTNPLPNGASGVELSSSTHNNVIGGIGAGEGNIIAYNATGVTIGPNDYENEVRGNSIHDNTGKGIYLVDNQAGTAYLPVITGVGPVVGTACPGCTVDVFSDAEDEGGTYLGTVTANGAGDWSFPSSGNGANVTATATTPVGSTSEFSAPFNTLTAGIIIVVTTANDVIANDGACSLREAIIAANNNANYFGCIGDGGGSDLIEFSIGDGVPVINVTSSLPTITHPVQISGAPNRVELHGPGSGTGLEVGVTAPNSIITRMVINNFATGIQVDAQSVKLTGNYIGTDASGMVAQPNTLSVAVYGWAAKIGGTNGTTPGGACTGDCNLISSTLYLSGNGAVVRGNFLSTDVLGTSALATGAGLELDPRESATIGGDTPAARNVIGNGIVSYGSPSTPPATAIIIKGNFIGVNSPGTGALDLTPITAGIYLEYMTNTPFYIQQNLISGNAIGVDLAGTVGVPLRGNYIGTQADGVSPLPNSGPGVFIHAYAPEGDGAHDNFVGGTQPGEGNIIAYNAGDGVVVDGADGIGGQPPTANNRIRGNSIHDNGGLGIDNVNGGNGELPPPQITATGSASGTACANCTVDVYSDSADEGRVYHGSAVADDNGDGTGDWSFPGPVIGPNVMATATNAGGNTSEFSAPFPCTGASDTDSDALCNSGDNCPSDANPGQENTDAFLAANGAGQGSGNPPPPLPADGLGDACDTDDDNDGFTDTVELAISTNPLDNCPAASGPGTNGDSWPLDNVVNGITNVVDLLAYKGKVPDNVPPQPKRLDLDDNNVLNVFDILLYKGKVPTSCN